METHIKNLAHRMSLDAASRTDRPHHFFTPSAMPVSIARLLVIAASLLGGIAVSTVSAAEVGPATAPAAASESVPAVAENTDKQDGDTEQEVVTLSEFKVSSVSLKDEYIASESVTATRVGMKVLDTPFSVEVLTYEFLNDFQLDAGNEQLSMISSSGGVLAGMTAKIRGFSRRYLVDGIDSRYALYPLPAIAVRQVEVVKGPQSANYGDSAPGGIVNHISKRPTVRPSFEFRSYAGTKDNYRAGVTASGPIPGVTDKDGQNKFFYRAWAELTHAPTNTIGSSNRVQSYGAAVMYKPNDKAAFTFTTSWRELERRGYQGETGDNRLRLSASEAVGSSKYLPNWKGVGRNLLSSKNARLYDEHLNFNFLWEQKISDSTSFQIQLNYLDFDKEAHRWNGGRYYYEQEGTIERRYPFKFFEDREVFVLKSDLTHKFRTPGISHKLLVGLDATKREVNEKSYRMPESVIDMIWPQSGKSDPTAPQWNFLPDVGYDTKLITEPVGMTKLEETDVGALGTLMSSTLKGRLKTYLAARYQYYTLDSGSYSRLVADGSLPDPFRINVFSEGDDYVGSYLAGFDYHIIREKLVFYASFAKGTNLTEIKADRGTGEVTEPPESKSYEFGFKGENIFGKLNYTLAFFHTTEDSAMDNEGVWDDTYIGLGTVPEFISGGRVRAKGVEINTSISFSRALTLKLTAGYTDSEILSSSNPHSIGQPASGTPKYMGAFTFRWRPVKKIVIGGRGTWQDELIAYQKPVSEAYEQQKMPSVFVMDIFANYEINRRKQGGYLHTVGFFIKNALDREYYTYTGRRYLGREFRLVYNIKS